MVAKAVFVFCAQALLFQCITAYILNDLPCRERAALNGEAYGPYASNPSMLRSEYSPANLVASNCGAFLVSSSSPIAPHGVTMISENAIEGPLAVGGEIPFLGAVAVEGPLPTAGAGGVSYNSGNGNVAILSEDLAGYGNRGANYGFGPMYGAY